MKKKIEIQDGFIEVDDQAQKYVKFLKMSWCNMTFDYENSLALLDIFNGFTSTQFSKGINFPLNGLIFSVAQKDKHFFLRIANMGDDIETFYGKMESKIFAGKLSRILAICDSHKGFGL